MFSHPNLKAITLQQPLADAMILGKKKVRVLGALSYTHTVSEPVPAVGGVANRRQQPAQRSSRMHLATSLWEKAGLLPSAFLKTVERQVSRRRLHALGQKSLGEGWLAADPVPARVYYPPPSSCVLGCRNTVRRHRHQHRLSLAPARRRFITLLRAAVC